ncbi:MAG: ankyrin repeat domain-containing protein [Bacteroidetes bacterium]|nr:ankyrin repeat domain-containing protein [Bacteroidota bacterium]
MKRKLQAVHQIVALGNTFSHTPNDLKDLIEDYLISNYEDYNAEGLLRCIISIYPDRVIQPVSLSDLKHKKTIDWNVINLMTAYMTLLLLNIGATSSCMETSRIRQEYHDLDYWMTLLGDVEYWEYWNASIFTMAGEIGSLKLMTYIYSQTYRPNIKKEAVVRAAANGHHHIIEFFIQNDLSALKAFGWEVFADALYLCCEGGCIDVAKLLVDKNLYTYKGPKYNYFSALVPASRSGNLELCDFLVKEIRNHEMDYEIAVANAAGYGHLHLVKYFEELGFDIHRYNEPIMYACDGGQMNVIEYLISKGSHFEPRFLVYALQNSHFKVAQFIMNHGIDLVSAVNCAAEEKAKKCVRYLTRQIIKRNPERLYEVKDYLTEYQVKKYNHLLTSGEFNLM